MVLRTHDLDHHSGLKGRMQSVQRIAREGTDYAFNSPPEEETVRFQARTVFQWNGQNL